MPKIRKAIMLQAACMELERRYMVEVDHEILELFNDPTNLDKRPAAIYEEKGINITANKILAGAFDELMTQLHKTQVKAGLATDFSKPDPFKHKRESRAAQALLDLHHALADRQAFNRAFMSIGLSEKISNDPDIIGLGINATKEEKQNFDWLAFLYSESFDPEKHLGDLVAESGAHSIKHFLLMI